MYDTKSINRKNINVDTRFNKNNIKIRFCA